MMQKLNTQNATQYLKNGGLELVLCCLSTPLKVFLCYSLQQTFLINEGNPKKEINEIERNQRNRGYQKQIVL